MGGPSAPSAPPPPPAPPTAMDAAAQQRAAQQARALRMRRGRASTNIVGSDRGLGSPTGPSDQAKTTLGA